MNSIIEAVDSFYKLAALLRAPESMVEEISKWAYSAYAKLMLPIINEEIERLSQKFFKNKPRIKELIYARGICMRYIRPDDTNPQKFRLKLSDTPYFSKVEQLDIDIQFKRQNLTPTIIAMLITSAEEAAKVTPQQWEGVWLSQKGSLLLYEKLLPAGIVTGELILRVFEMMRRTIRHELQHMVQQYLQHIKGLSEWGGLPSTKLRDVKKVGPHGDYLLQPGETEPQPGMVEHPLRDIEFYTNLSDAVSFYELVVNRFPITLRRLLFNVFISVSPIEELERTTLQEYKRDKSLFANIFGAKTFREIMPGVMPYIITGRRTFETIKNNQPDKYRKMVTEFYKAVQRYL